MEGTMRTVTLSSNTTCRCCCFCCCRCCVDCCCFLEDGLRGFRPGIFSWMIEEDRDESRRNTNRCLDVVVVVPLLFGSSCSTAK